MRIDRAPDAEAARSGSASASRTATTTTAADEEVNAEPLLGTSITLARRHDGHGGRFLTGDADDVDDVTHAEDASDGGGGQHDGHGHLAGAHPGARGGSDHGVRCVGRRAAKAGQGQDDSGSGQGGRDRPTVPSNESTGSGEAIGEGLTGR